MYLLKNNACVIMVDNLNNQNHNNKTNLLNNSVSKQISFDEKKVFKLSQASFNKRTSNNSNNNNTKTIENIISEKVNISSNQSNSTPTFFRSPSNNMDISNNITESFSKLNATNSSSFNPIYDETIDATNNKTGRMNLSDIQLAQIKKKSSRSVSYWSSNVSVRSEMGEITDKINLKKNEINAILEIIDPNIARPITARSLPSRVRTDVTNTVVSSRLTNESASYRADSAKLKNPLCPGISLSTQTTLLNLSSQNTQDLDDQKDTDSLKSNDSSIIYMPNDMKQQNVSFDKQSLPNTQQPQQSVNNKTNNLELFLKYTSSPFTTKFEIIGSENKSLDSNNYLNTSCSKSANIARSHSATGLDDHTQINKSNLSQPSNSQISINELNFKYLANGNSEQNLFDLGYDKEESLKNSSFLRITDDLYIGNMSCLKNERSLCKLNIEYLIDMTGMRPDDLNRQTLGRIPCLCERQHSRLYLTVEIGETSFKPLFCAFNELNKFIQQTRKFTISPKKVLIFSRDLLASHVVCACAQFLMIEYELSIDAALHVVMQRPKIYEKSGMPVGKKLEQCYMEYLKQFEIYLRHIPINLNGGRVGRKQSINSKSKKYYILNDQFSTDNHSLIINDQKLAYYDERQDEENYQFELKQRPKQSMGREKDFDDQLFYSMNNNDSVPKKNFLDDVELFNGQTLRPNNDGNRVEMDNNPKEYSQSKKNNNSKMAWM